MRILILSDSFPPEKGGGAERVAFNLASGLYRKGHQVFVITTTQRKKIDKVPKPLGEEFQGLKVFRIYVNYHQRWRAYLSLYNPQAVGQVRELIKNIRPDVIHVHNLHYYLSYACLKIAKKYSQAVFLTAHDVMLFHYGKLIEFIRPNDLSIPKDLNYKITPWQQIKRFKKRYNPFRNIIIRHYLKYVDKIFAVSYALKGALFQNGIDKVAVIYNGIETKEWQISQDQIENFNKKYNLFNKKVIFFAGRLSALKGGEKILRAMKIVKEQVPEAVLLVVGVKNTYAQQMLELAQSQEVSLILTGWLTGDELKAAYCSSDICLTPSIYLDPFNLINIEAMAAKKPVIGTCFGGTSEIILDGLTGYLVNPFDIKLIAEKIITLLKNPQKAKQLGETGYERVKEYFSLDKQIEETINWYRLIID